MKWINFAVAIVVALSTINAFAKSEEKSAGTNRPALQLCEAHLNGKRSLAFQYQPAQPGKPTFLLLPGVNRATLLSDPALQVLAADGSGIITFNFSVQPLSIAELPERERANLEQVTLQSLAQETLAIAKKIEKEHGVPLRDMVPVSLSYTGAISPFLTAFPTIIDMVPLTSMSAYSPQLDAYYQNLKRAELFNPIFGPGITRSALDVAYRSEWVKQVDSISKQYDLPTARRTEMIEGYMTLSRAVEGFSWEKQAPSKKVKRIFVLAENEAKVLLADQIQTILSLKSKGYDVATIFIAGSGHIIPAEQPLGYVAALKGVAAGTIATGTVSVIDVKRGTAITVEGEKADEFLKAILRKK